MYDINQSDVSINENSTANLFTDEATTAQGPTDDNNKIKSLKACTMEMSMNDSGISMTTMIEHKLAKENHKKFLYARAYIQIIRYNITWNNLWSVKRWLMNTEAWWKKEGISSPWNPICSIVIW